MKELMTLGWQSFVRNGNLFKLLLCGKGITQPDLN